MILGDRVGEMMRERGLSQSELARRVGVTQPTIYKLLKSSKKGSTYLHVIARELGTTPAYLSGEVDDPHAAVPALPELTAGEWRWVEIWRAMSTGQRKLMVQLAGEIIGPEREKADA